MSYPSKRFARKLIALAPALCAAGIANAQQLEEVVVTAQKREQNVQEVPIAVSAFSQEMLQNRGVGNITDLANITPNVILDGGTPFSGSTTILAAYVRGIGQNDFAMNFDPGVGVYVDGVYLARAVGANISLPDVERVEILKGPQGSLFGRNTIGGAVSVVTRTPGDEFEIEGSYTVGEFDRSDAALFVAGPITDTLKGSITYASHQRDGYQKRIPWDTPVNRDPQDAFIDPTVNFKHGLETNNVEGGIDDYTTRAKLVFDPSDQLRLSLSGDFTKVDQPAMPNTVIDIVTNDGLGSLADLYNTCVSLPADFLGQIGLGGICGPRGNSLKPEMIIPGLGGLNADGDPNNDRLLYTDQFLTDDIDKTYATGQSFTKMENWGVNFTVDYEINDNLALKSITGYRDLEWNTGLDLDGSPLDILGTTPTFGMVQDQFSTELQLIGTALDGAMQFVVGAMWFEEEGALQDTVNFSGGILQILGPNDLATENWGLYSHIDWRVNELIGLTFGLRYTEEEKTFTGYQTDNNALNYKGAGIDAISDPNILIEAGPALGFPVYGEPLRYFVGEEQRKEFDNLDPRIGVQFYLSEDLMVYGSYATGLKTGGWSTRLSNPLDYAPSFDEETAETWELGIKSQWFDNMVQLNGAVFTTDFEDIQLNYQLGVSPTIQNAGDAEIKGFELELVAAPVDGLNIVASVGYLDTEYTSVLEQSQVDPWYIQAGVFDGAELPKAPEWQFNISPSYRMTLGNGGTLMFLVDYSWQSELWNDTERSYLLQRGDIENLNASITYTDPDDHWDVVFGGTNLTDERYITTGQAQLGGGQIYGTYSRPEEWYLTFRYRN